MLVSARKNMRLIAGLLAILMVMATGPFAHAGTQGAANAPGRHHVSAQVHHGDAAHHATAPTKHQHQAAVDCCDDLGLCAAVALVLTTDAMGHRDAGGTSAPARLSDVAGLYDPGLDLPPPRHS
jgi:hypothetical protein